MGTLFGTVMHYINETKTVVHDLGSLRVVPGPGSWPLALAQLPQSRDHCCLLILNFMILYCVNVCLIG